MTIEEMHCIDEAKKVILKEIDRLSRIIKNRHSDRLMSWVLKERMKFREVLSWLKNL